MAPRKVCCGLSSPDERHHHCQHHRTSLRSLFDAQHRASRAQVDVPLALRRDKLQRMRRLLDEHGPALALAVQADFGVRSPQLTEIADLFVLRTLLSHTLKHLPKWGRPETFRPDHGAAQALVVRRSSALVFSGRREGIIKRCC